MITIYRDGERLVFSFDGGVGKPFSWAAKITRNKAIDRLRVLQRRQMFEDPADSDGEDQVVCESGTDESVWRERAAQIRAEIKRLPLDQRSPIELAFFSGLTHVEIAEALGEPLGTIKARIQRGMLRLRVGLQDRL